MEAEKIVALGLEIVYREVQHLHEIAQARQLSKSEAILLRGYMRIALDAMEVDLPVFMAEINVSRMSLEDIDAALGEFFAHRAKEIGARENGFALPE